MNNKINYNFEENIITMFRKFKKNLFKHYNNIKINPFILNKNQIINDTFIDFMKKNII
jgi:hypothetical protein